MSPVADVAPGGTAAVEVSLEHMLTRTARAFGVTSAQMRVPRDTKIALPARLAFCRMAKFAGAGELAIGMKISRNAAWVDVAVWRAGRLLETDGNFAERYREVELECVAEAHLSAATVYPLPVDRDPRAIAERLVESPREAMRVGVADLATLGAAYLALSDELEQLRASRAAPVEPASKDLENGQAA